MSPRRDILVTRELNVLPKYLGEMSQHVCDADATRHFPEKNEMSAFRLLQLHKGGRVIVGHDAQPEASSTFVDAPRTGDANGRTQEGGVRKRQVVASQERRIHEIGGSDAEKAVSGGGDDL